MKLGIDKYYHFLIGMLLVLMSHVCGLGPMSTVLIVLVAAIGKEIYDEITYGGFDWYDILATLLPLLTLLIL